METSKLKQSFIKRDKYGAELHPGDTCVWCSKHGGILCIYVRPAKGGKTGKYGEFHTPIGLKTVALNNVVVAYDPLGRRVVNHEITKQLMRNYYG